MQMTKGEIIADYKQAKHKAKHVQTLADLNACPVSEIKAVLYEAGLIGAEPVVPAADKKARRAWTAEDDAELRRLFEAGYADRAIAAALDRGRPAVSERRRVLGLLREKKPIQVQKTAPVIEVAADDKPASAAEAIVAEAESSASAVTLAEAAKIALRKMILARAEECVCTDRNMKYGEPEDNFAVIASLWEPYIKARCVGADASVDITARDVAMLMALFKIGRAATAIESSDDTLVDIAGYAACAAGM